MKIKKDKSTLYCLEFLELLEKYMQKEIVIECKRNEITKEAIKSGDSYLYSGYYSPSFKEALMALYVDYKNDPKAVLKAIDKEISGPNGFLLGKYKKTEAEIQTWKDLKKYIQKPFSEFKVILY